MRPEAGFEWDRKLRIFTKEQVDSQTGIKTLWQINPATKGTYRVDQLPNNGLTRAIYDRPKRTLGSLEGLLAESTQGLERTYEITDRSTNWTRSYWGRIVNQDFEEFGIGLLADEREQDFMRLETHYGSDGVYRSASLLVNPRGRDKIVELPLEAKLNYFAKRSVRDNLNELAGIYRSISFGLLDPKKHFMLPRPKSGSFKDLEEAVAYIVENEKGWTEETIGRVSREAAVTVNGMIRRYLSSEFTEEQRANLSSVLMLELLRHLRPDFYNLEGDEKVRELLATFQVVVADLLAFHYQELSRIGSYEVKFNFNTPHGYQLKIEGEADEPLLVGDEVEFGEEYRYEEYTYLIEQPEKGRLRLSVLPLLPVRVTRQFELPERVNYQQFYDLASSEGSNDWEKALSVIQASRISLP